MGKANPLRSLAPAGIGLAVLLCCLAACNPVENLYVKYNKRSFSLLAEGRYDEALTATLEALHFAEITFGGDSVYAAEPSANLGSCYRLMGRYEEAEAPLQRAISLFEHHFGAQDARLGVPLASLGELYMSQGQFEKAEPLLERALAIRRTFSDGGRMAAVSLGSLGELHRRTKRYERAEELLVESRRVLRAAGDEPLRLATVLVLFGRFLTEQNRYAEADPLLKEALDLRRAHLRSHHPLIGSTLRELAAWNRAQGLVEEAKRLEAEADSLRSAAPSAPA